MRGRLKLPNDNLDVGTFTAAGKYRLTDAAYSELLHKLQRPLHGTATGTPNRYPRFLSRPGRSHFDQDQRLTIGARLLKSSITCSLWIWTSDTLRGPPSGTLSPNENYGADPLAGSDHSWRCVTPPQKSRRCVCAIFLICVLSRTFEHS